MRVEVVKLEEGAVAVTAAETIQSLLVGGTGDEAAIATLFVGFVPTVTGRPVLIGSVGGPYHGAWFRIREWQQEVTKFLVERKLPFFYHGLEPDVDPRGGLLRPDWNAPDTEKLDLMKQAATTETNRIAACR